MILNDMLYHNLFCWIHNDFIWWDFIDVCIYKLLSSATYWQKHVRFPKGKKVKQRDNTIDGHEDKPSEWRDPRLATKERSVRRNQIIAELLDEENEGEVADISQAEVEYELQENETFIDDEIAIEPFNLNTERIRLF